jgi:hypothetical protein
MLKTSRGFGGVEGPVGGGAQCGYGNGLMIRCMHGGKSRDFLQEARRQRMLELHACQKPRDRRPHMLLIPQVREMLLLDTDKQTLQWLRPFNPLLCTTQPGQAALLLTKDTSSFVQGNNNPVVSFYILQKAQGACASRSTNTLLFHCTIREPEAHACKVPSTSLNYLLANNRHKNVLQKADFMHPQL